MRSKLLKEISNSLGIEKYNNEPESSYTYRLIYSALAAWCSKIAQDKRVMLIEDASGFNNVSKSHVTQKINELLNGYLKIFPEVEGSFDSQKEGFAPYLRKTFEYAGYFISDNQKVYLRNNDVVRFVECSEDKEKLIIGEYFNGDHVRGAGIYREDVSGCEKATMNDIVLSRFENYEKEIRKILKCKPIQEYGDIEYLNNFKNPNSSKIESWSDFAPKRIGIAKNRQNQEFYLYDKVDEEIRYYRLPEIYNKIIGINRYEINRMVYWVRAFRKFPQRIYYRILDEKYVQIHLTNDVPFREQIALRLLGWPKDYFWNRWDYVVPQENFMEVTKIFKNLQGDMVEKYGY